MLLTLPLFMWVMARLQESLKEKTRAWYWALVFAAVFAAVISESIINTVHAWQQMRPGSPVLITAVIIIVTVGAYVLPVFLYAWSYFAILRRFSYTAPLWWVVFFLMPLLPHFLILLFLLF